jgi:hypothetical protein
MITSSTQPRKYPASSPSRNPKVPETMTLATPTVSETRAPSSSRASRSRPSGSVPKMCRSPLAGSVNRGGLLRSRMLVT